MGINKDLRLLFILGFFMALAVALPAYIHSSFLGQFIGVNLISLFFVGAMFGALLLINFFPKLIKKIGNYRAALAVFISYAVVSILLVSFQSPVLIFIFFALLNAIILLLMISMDIFVERFSQNAITGRIRTIYFTCINIGWVISPWLASRLIGANNRYYLVYLVAAVAIIPVVLSLIFQKEKYKDRPETYEHHSFIYILKRVWRDRNVRGIFTAATSLQFFYALVIVYLPIHLNQTLNIPWSVLGVIFTIALLPFILIEIPAGIIADKYLGEKEMLILGLFILVATSFSMFFITSASPWLWGIILFLSRCGAALVEAMRETYFFKLFDVKDVDYINLFRDTQPLGYIIAAIFAGVILSFCSLNYLFIYFAVVLLLSIYPVLRIKDTK